MDGLTIVAMLAVVLMAAGALALALRPSAGGARLLVPHTVQACIFSFDDATQSWAKLLALLGEVRARARHMASHTPPDYPTTHRLTVRALPVAQLRARGFHIALATSLPRSEFEAKMAELPAVLEAMDAIVTGNEVTKPKPAPFLFLEAARRLRVDATRCVVFDESPAGIEGAQAAGMLTAAVGPGVGARFSALSPDWMLRDISAFDPRDIELPKGNGTEAEEEEEVTGLAALAKLLPPGSALQKCLAGAAGQQGGYNGLGV